MSSILITSQARLTATPSSASRSIRISAVCSGVKPLTTTCRRRPDLDEPLLKEQAEGLPHRRAGGTEGRGDLLFGKDAAGRKSPRMIPSRR